MVAAAVGGTLLFISILMFVVVAVMTKLHNEPGTTVVKFAEVDDRAIDTPLVFDKFGRWAAIAIVLAIGAYAGPMRDLLAVHTYLIPGMRTW